MCSCLASKLQLGCWAVALDNRLCVTALAVLHRGITPHPFLTCCTQLQFEFGKPNTRPVVHSLRVSDVAPAERACQGQGWQMAGCEDSLVLLIQSSSPNTAPPNLSPRNLSFAAWLVTRCGARPLPPLCIPQGHFRKSSADQKTANRLHTKGISDGANILLDTRAQQA